MSHLCSLVSINALNFGGSFEFWMLLYVFTFMDSSLYDTFNIISVCVFVYVSWRFWSLRVEPTIFNCHSLKRVCRVENFHDSCISGDQTQMLALAPVQLSLPLKGHHLCFVLHQPFCVYVHLIQVCSLSVGWYVCKSVCSRDLSNIDYSCSLWPAFWTSPGTNPYSLINEHCLWKQLRPVKACYYNSLVVSALLNTSVPLQ